MIIPISNLLEYSSKYSDTTGSLWFYNKIKQLILIMILRTLTILKLSSIKINYWVAQPVPNQANGIVQNATINNIFLEIT